MPNDVGIFNLTLLHLGIDQISGFADGTAEADAGAAQYAITRDSLLELADWAFAFEYGTALTADAAVPTPTNGRWKYQFALPADLRTIKRVHDADLPIPFLHVATDRIYAEQNTNVSLDYMRNVGESKFSNLFVKALSYQLAADVAMTLTGDRALLGDMQQQAFFWIGVAKNREAFQQLSQNVLPSHVAR